MPADVHSTHRPCAQFDREVTAEHERPESSPLEVYKYGELQTFSDIDIANARRLTARHRPRIM
jgi:hypothetical protein